MPAFDNLTGRRFLLFAAVLGLVAGCAGSSPTIDTSDEADMTFDGLYPVKGGTADQAWARPGADISQYSKIMLQGVGVEYRPGGESGRLYNIRRGGDYFELTEKQKNNFEQVMREEFLEELAKSEHFAIVSEAGPDVLLIRGGLIDVVSYVPPDPIGMSDIYISRVGEATLVLEIRDSISEAVIARAVDRRAAEDSLGFNESTPARNRAEIRRLARTWARLLRERLDSYAAPAE